MGKLIALQAASEQQNRPAAGRDTRWLVCVSEKVEAPRIEYQTSNCIFVYAKSIESAIEFVEQARNRLSAIQRNP